MLSATVLNANLVTDMHTNPISCSLAPKKCMDSMAIPMANPGTDMPTNPTVVQLHIEMHDFCNITQCKPCNRHAYKPYQLFTCTQKCTDSIAIPMANPGTDMLTNPTVVQLHVKMHGFHGNSHIGEFKCMQNSWENTLSDPNACKTLGKSQAVDFPARPGQLPHSHIGELECMQNTKENILSDPSVWKTRGKSQVPDFLASYRTAI